MIYKGSCHCEAVAFEVEADEKVAVVDADAVSAAAADRGDRVLCIRRDDGDLDLGRGRRNLCCDHVDDPRGDQKDQRRRNDIGLPGHCSRVGG